MSGMFDKLFDEKAKKIKDDFDQRLSVMENELKKRFDTLEKILADMSAKVK